MRKYERAEVLYEQKFGGVLMQMLKLLYIANVRLPPEKAHMYIRFVRNVSAYILCALGVRLGWS